MADIFNPGYLNLPQQVEKNKSDIKNIKDNSINIYYCNIALSQVGNSVNVDDTTFTGNNTNITGNSILIDTIGSIFKIVAYVEVSGEPPQLIIEFKSSLRGVPGPQGLPGEAGEPGEPGEGFNFMGSWVSNNEYYKNDVVTYASGEVVASYVLISESLVGSTTPPNVDTTNWSVMVSVNFSTNLKTTFKTPPTSSTALFAQISNINKYEVYEVYLKVSGYLSTNCIGYYNYSAIGRDGPATNSANFSDITASGNAEQVIVDGIYKMANTFVAGSPSTFICELGNASVSSKTIQTTTLFFNSSSNEVMLFRDVNTTGVNYTDNQLSFRFTSYINKLSNIYSEYNRFQVIVVEQI